MSLFKIECICDDKNLAKVLRALASVGAKNVMPIPMVNGNSSTNGLAPNVAAVWEKIKEAKVNNVTSADMKNLLQDVGLQKSSYSYVLSALVKAKLMKKGARGHYEVRQ